MAAFSFYPTKNLGGVGDGGAVAANDDAIDARVRQLRQYGWTSKYRIEVAGGRNSRLDELQAAVLRIGLVGLDARTNADARSWIAIGMPATGCPSGSSPAPGARRSPTLPSCGPATGTSCGMPWTGSGIDTDVHYPLPDHLQPGLPPPSRVTDLRETEVAAREILTLPCFPSMTDEDVVRVADVLRSSGTAGA